MPSMQQSEALSSSTFQRRRDASGEGRTTQRAPAEVIPFPLRQSAGISAPADKLARHLVSVLRDLLGAEALRSHREWLSGMLAEPRRQVRPLEEYLPRLERTLLELLRDAAVEDGLTHPGEAVLRRALTDYPSEVRAWLAERTTSGAAGGRASLLRLVGRMPRLQATPWAHAIVSSALKDGDLEVRDAAIKALELWRGSSALKLLEQHLEPEPWLADHVRRVVEELKLEV